MKRLGICLRRTLPLPVILTAILASGAAGEVVRVVVERTEDVLDGREWGDAGAYEKLVGRVYFAFDPENPFNVRIVDLEWAPKNGEGMVEGWADFMVLQPKDPSRRRGVAWVEVGNRGRKSTLRYFHRASSGATDPASEGDFGDGLFFEQGLTIIWLGWQWDVPATEGLFRLHLPIARLPGGSIEGLARSDWTVDADTEVLLLGHRGHRPYQPAALDHPEHVLTQRDGRDAPRDTIPRDRWAFLSPEDQPTEEIRGIVRTDGGMFEAGKIYELVYQARDPRVVGLGLAAIRDILSYAKYDLDSPFPVNLGLAFGVSQTGRFLRHFLYQGFNTDERGRKVFDGLFIHTAGAGRGSFNHRFGQASRDAHRYSAFFYPTDLFPFTSKVQVDPVTGREGGLFAHTRPEHLPKVFYTNTGYEYWGRAASLIHTSVAGNQDVDPTPNERIYHIASAQHSVGEFPPAESSLKGSDGLPAYRGHPMDFSFTLRALSLHLLNWVEEEEEPPASAFPKIGAGTLVPASALAFPRLPGVDVPEVVHQAYRADYGPRWWEDGIIDRQPPELGPTFLSQVSQVDGLGNEVAGIRGTELRAPLATYAPWNLRWGAEGSPEELTDFRGTFIPLSKTEEERAEREDPRPSAEALYRDRAGYLERVRAATIELVREGFLLGGDAATAVEAAAALWDWLMDPGDGNGAEAHRQ